MAEERIEIKYNKEDCPCIKCESVMSCEERNCEKLAEWECQEKDIVYNRQEAIERMAKAICSKWGISSCKSCAFKGDGSMCQDFIDGKKSLAEAALTALLEGK